MYFSQSVTFLPLEYVLNYDTKLDIMLDWGPLLRSDSEAEPWADY